MRKARTASHMSSMPAAAPAGTGRLPIDDVSRRALGNASPSTSRQALTVIIAVRTFASGTEQILPDALLRERRLVIASVHHCEQMFRWICADLAFEQPSIAFKLSLRLDDVAACEMSSDSGASGTLS